MTLFHLVRHGSHDLLGQVFVGRGPVDISTLGQSEATAVAEALSNAGLAAVISSPQERAQQTARVVAARAGLVVQIEPGIAELDMGIWTGSSFALLDDDPRWHAFNRFRGTAPIPGGETMLAAQARALEAVLRLRVSYPDAALALVSHADMIKAILMHFLGMPLDFMRRIEVAPGSRSILELREQDGMVHAVNLPALS